MLASPSYAVCSDPYHGGYPRLGKKWNWFILYIYIFVYYTYTVLFHVSVAYIYII